jgi:hypothetical protein
MLAAVAVFSLVTEVRNVDLFTMVLACCILGVREILTVPSQSEMVISSPLPILLRSKPNTIHPRKSPTIGTRMAYWTFTVKLKMEIPAMQHISI